MDSKALDGLRGVLALYIVVYHDFLAMYVHHHQVLSTLTFSTLTLSTHRSPSLSSCWLVSLQLVLNAERLHAWQKLPAQSCGFSQLVWRHQRTLVQLLRLLDIASGHTWQRQIRPSTGCRMQRRPSVCDGLSQRGSAHLEATNPSDGQAWLPQARGTR